MSEELAKASRGIKTQEYAIVNWNFDCPGAGESLNGFTTLACGSLCGGAKNAPDRQSRPAPPLSSSSRFILTPQQQPAVLPTRSTILKVLSFSSITYSAATHFRNTARRTMASIVAPDTLHIAILECDTPPDAILAAHGTYGAMFRRLLSTAASSMPAAPRLTFSTHNVTSPSATYPSLTAPPPSPTAILLTGSRHNAFDDAAWITRLTDYVAACLASGSRTRVLGICFGHQIVGRALGLPVARNEKGWEVSVVPIKLAGAGQRLFGEEGGETLRLHQMHRDIVAPAATPETAPTLRQDPSKPADRTREEPTTTASTTDALEAPRTDVVQLGTTALCATQGMLLPGRALTVQGHPEYSGDVVRTLLDARHEQGIIPDAVYQDAIARVDNEHDGVRVARGMLRFLMAV